MKRKPIPARLVKDALDYLEPIVETMVETFHYTQNDAPLVLRVVNWYQHFEAEMRPYLGRPIRTSPRKRAVCRLQDPKVIYLSDPRPSRACGPGPGRHLPSERGA